MCLTTTHKEFKTEKDITTFKAVIIDKKTGKWKGVYRNNNKRFLFDAMLENKERKDVSCVTAITTGDNFFTINGGFFHSSEKLDIANYHRTCSDMFALANKTASKVFECTIPKGTICYKDDSGNWASRKIIVHSIQKAGLPHKALPLEQPVSI